MSTIDLKCRIDNIDEFDELAEEIQTKANDLVDSLKKLSGFELKFAIRPETEDEKKEK